MPDSTLYWLNGRLRPEREALIPVREVDGRPLRHCPGPIFSTLTRAFHEQVERETHPEGQAT